MILGVTVAAQRLSAGAFEVQAGGVHEHQVETGEQIAPVREQSLLDQILDAAGCERGAAVLILLRQHLTEPGHRPIKLMQIEGVDAVDPVVLAPAIRRAIGAADEQPVQHGEEHRSFQRKAVLARAGQFINHRAAAGLFPKSFEHQRCPDAPSRDRCCGVVLERMKHHRLGGKARARSQQPLQLAAGLQLVVTSERGDHLLANLVALTPALDDLQVGAPARGLAPKVHQRLRVLVSTESRF